MRFGSFRAMLDATKGVIVNTILLATDGSASARVATTEAIELAKATGWPLHVLTVWDLPWVPGYGYAPAAYVPVHELCEAEEEHAAEAVDKAVESAAKAGVTVTSSIRKGYAADEICEAAEELGAGLVIMGARGWGAFKRLVFGSVSTGVLHHAKCPVLVVRVEDSEATDEPVAA
ncbi:MAG TPA: universal stress protein [Gaiellaceae bacterium]|jgi:nucleotide-binding universal stress UspA family protein